MSFSIIGTQFVDIPGGSVYSVVGIPAGFVYDSIELPEDWGFVNRVIISPTQDDIQLVYGIGSGTIIVKYLYGDLIKYVYLDVYCKACRMGEEIAQEGVIFIPASKYAQIDICGISRCVFPLEVFADLNNQTDDLRNDRSDFYGNIGGIPYYGYANITSITLTLQKLVNDIWTDQVIIVDNSYGNFVVYGKSPDFSGNNFTDDYGKKYTGVVLKWLNILISFGDGKYRMKVDYLDVINGHSTLYDVRLFCLYQWNCNKPNGTVRIETVNQGFRGTLYDNTIQIDYSTGWYSQIRLRGLFLYKNSGYIKEYNQIGDGGYNAYKPIILEQTPKFSLTKLYVPGWLAWYLSTNTMQADQILITDYNTSNRMPLVKTPLVIDGEFSIPENNLVDPTGDVNIALKINFAYGQNSLRRRNSG